MNHKPGRTRSTMSYLDLMNFTPPMAYSVFGCVPSIDSL